MTALVFCLLLMGGFAPFPSPRVGQRRRMGYPGLAPDRNDPAATDEATHDGSVLRWNRRQCGTCSSSHQLTITGSRHHSASNGRPIASIAEPHRGQGHEQDLITVKSITS